MSRFSLRFVFVVDAHNTINRANVQTTVTAAVQSNSIIYYAQNSKLLSSNVEYNNQMDTNRVRTTYRACGHSVYGIWN